MEAGGDDLNAVALPGFIDILSSVITVFMFFMLITSAVMFFLSMKIKKQSEEEVKQAKNETKQAHAEVKKVGDQTKIEMTYQVKDLLEQLKRGEITVDQLGKIMEASAQKAIADQKQAEAEAKAASQQNQKQGSPTDGQKAADANDAQKQGVTTADAKKQGSPAEGDKIAGANEELNKGSPVEGKKTGGSSDTHNIGSPIEGQKIAGASDLQKAGSPTEAQKQGAPADGQKQAGANDAQKQGSPTEALKQGAPTEAQKQGAPADGQKASLADAQKQGAPTEAQKQGAPAEGQKVSSAEAQKTDAKDQTSTSTATSGASTDGQKQAGATSHTTPGGDVGEGDKSAKASGVTEAKNQSTSNAEMPATANGEQSISRLSKSDQNQQSTITSPGSDDLLIIFGSYGISVTDETVKTITAFIEKQTQKTGKTPKIVLEASDNPTAVSASLSRESELGRTLNVRNVLLDKKVAPQDIMIHNVEPRQENNTYDWVRIHVQK